MWDLLVTETNRYAQVKISHKPNARAWNDVTVIEMKVFIGMTILLGIIRLPRIEMYWQTTKWNCQHNEPEPFSADLQVSPSC